jgi:hypothetical protein
LLSASASASAISSHNPLPLPDSNQDQSASSIDPDNELFKFLIPLAVYFFAILQASYLYGNPQWLQ